MMNDFHFLRPEWLYALLPLIIITYLLARQLGSQTNWQNLINPELLKHLIDQPKQTKRRSPIIAMGVLWGLLAIAAAGPTWEKLPQPTIKKEHSLLVLWDLSPSLRSEDVKPNRLDRSRFKLIDLLNQRKEGQTGLIVYAGEAYVVTPLSDDTETINSQLNALVPELMPVRGSNTEMAIERALEVFQDSNVISGDILLITDGVVPLAAQTINYFLSGTRHRLSVLGIGTEQGAPVPLAEEFARTSSGDIIIDKPDFALLANLAQDNGGRYAQLSLNNRDVDYLTQMFSTHSENDVFGENSENDREYDSWSEVGPWLVLLLLPFVAAAFRRGWLVPMVCVTSMSLLHSQEASAYEWTDLWQTKDQQGYELLKDGAHGPAAETFTDPQWKGSAEYKNGNFEAASELFSGNTASAHYNRGNALAKSGKLDEAISAYEQALALNSELTVAQENKALLEQLKQQQQDQQQDQQSDDQQQQDQQDQQQQDGDSDQSEQQNGEQSDSQEFADNEQSKQQDEQQQDAEPQEGEQPDEQQDSEQSQEQDVAEQKPDEESEGDSEQNTELAQTELTDEQKQALEQWLKQVPDDPAGLLRRKFQHQYRQRRQEYRSGQWQLPSNNAASRL